MTDLLLNTIIDASVLSDAIDALNVLAQESILHITPHGIYANPCDPANVAVTNLTINQSAFESYEANEFTVGVGLERLGDYVNKAESDSLVNLTFDNVTRRFGIDIGTAEFTMNGLDPESVRNGQDIEEMDVFGGFTTDVTMDGAAIKHAVDVCDMVSDHVVIDTDPDRDKPLHFIGQGDTDDVVVRFHDSLHDGSTIPEQTDSVYSIDYFSDLVKPVPKQAEARLRNNGEYPLCIEYELNDGSVTVQSLLAPRIRSD